MATLRIETSVNRENSVTRKLTDRIISTLGDSDVVTRDIANEPLPLIDSTWASARVKPADERSTLDQEALALSDALVAEVSKTLKLGGKFAFNTSFFEGGQTPESRKFYRKWMLKSSRILRQEYGLKPARVEKVESRKHLTVDEYRALVERHGLSVVRHEIDSVNVPIEGWLDISGFEYFITGIMPGVPLDKASAALQKGLTQTFEEMKIQYVSRNWLDMLAVRV